jgi:hypothetical protein
VTRTQATCAQRDILLLRRQVSSIQCPTSPTSELEIFVCDPTGNLTLTRREINVFWSSREIARSCFDSGEGPISSRWAWAYSLKPWSCTGNDHHAKSRAAASTQGEGPISSRWAWAYSLKPWSCTGNTPVFRHTYFLDSHLQFYHDKDSRCNNLFFIRFYSLYCGRFRFSSWSHSDLQSSPRRSHPEMALTGRTVLNCDIAWSKESTICAWIGCDGANYMLSRAKICDLSSHY